MDSSTSQPLLTVIIPVYNEASTIDELLARVVAAPFDKQIVVVDDGSSDGTRASLSRWEGRHSLEVLYHQTNQGKGAAIRTALQRACGRWTIVQDADLEYDPQDYGRLLAPLLAGSAEAVFGSRYLLRERSPPRPGRLMRWGVGLLNLCVLILYRVRLTDEATCYKVVRTETLRRMELQCRRFEFCPEVTAKLCRMGVPIREEPIRYLPRNVEAGKKIRWIDGLAAVRELWKWRQWDPLSDGWSGGPTPAAESLQESARSDAASPRRTGASGF